MCSHQKCLSFKGSCGSAIYRVTLTLKPRELFYQVKRRKRAEARKVYTKSCNAHLHVESLVNTSRWRKHPQKAHKSHPAIPSTFQYQAVLHQSKQSMSSPRVGYNRVNIGAFIDLVPTSQYPATKHSVAHGTTQPSSRLLQIARSINQQLRLKQIR